eukprot:2501687-Amphidinium_carterae.1
METHWLQYVLTGTGKDALDYARAAYESSHVSISCSRRNNRQMLQALDRLLVVMKVRLDHFKPSSIVCATSRDEREYHAEVAGESRVLVRQASGRKRFKLCRVELGECKDFAPVLHCSLDQGGIGVPMTLYLLLKEKLRMSVSYDINHRVHNDVLLASTHAGLTDLRLEARVALKARAGPFQSGSFLHCIKGIAQEFFTLHSYGNPLFLVVYEEMVDGQCCLSETHAVGTPEHMLHVWETLRDEASGCKLDAMAEASRWFSWEVASRHFLPHRWLYVMLLTYLPRGAIESILGLESKIGA